MIKKYQSNSTAFYESRLYVKSCFMEKEIFVKWKSENTNQASDGPEHILSQSIGEDSCFLILGVNVIRFQPRSEPITLHFIKHQYQFHMLKLQSC